MTIRTETREQAFMLYCAGVAQEKIANRLKIGKRTIETWIPKYEWKRKRDELAKYAQENATLADKEKEDKMLEFLLAKGLEFARENKMRYNARDISELIKLRGLRRGEATERTEFKGQTIQEAYEEHLKKKEKNA